MRLNRTMHAFVFYWRHQWRSIAWLVIPSVAIFKLQRDPYRFSLLWECDRTSNPVRWLMWCSTINRSAYTNSRIRSSYIQQRLFYSNQFTDSLNCIVHNGHSGPNRYDWAGLSHTAASRMLVASVLPHQIKASNSIPHPVRSSPHHTTQRDNTLPIMLLSLLRITGINTNTPTVHLHTHRSIRSYRPSMSMIFRS